MEIVAVIVTVGLVLVIVGLILWLLNAFVPMYPPIRIILNAFAVIAVVLWVLRHFGVVIPLRLSH